LHILATQGTLGGIALLMLLAGSARAIWRIWRDGDQPLIVAVAASLTSLAVTNMVGFTMIATGSLFAVCLGLVSRWGESSAEEVVPLLDTPWRRFATLPLGIAVVVLTFVGVWRPFQADLACRRGEIQIVDAPAQALTCYRQATELDPDCDFYWVRLADAALRTNSFDDRREAYAALEKAAALVPADAYHHSNLARLYGDDARTDRSQAKRAGAEWRQTLELDPNNPSFLIDATRTAVLFGDHDSARTYANRGIQLYPSWAIFHSLLGATEMADNHLPDAARELDVSLTGDWRNDNDALSRALASLAAVELRRQNYTKAQEMAGKASVWLPSWSTPHVLRGQALEGLGLRDEAAREFRAASWLANMHAEKP
jgi:tetratricopeptide (TPR) repeat protein